MTRTCCRTRRNLKSGYYNWYRQQLLERVRFERTISLPVGFHAPDYLLDELLRERYPPPLESSKAEELLEKAKARSGGHSHFSRRTNAYLSG